MLIFCYSSLDHSFYTCKTCKPSYSLCFGLSCLVITIVFFSCYAINFEGIKYFDSFLFVTIVFFSFYLSDIDNYLDNLYVKGQNIFVDSSYIKWKNKTLEYYVISNIFSYCIFVLKLMEMDSILHYLIELFRFNSIPIP